MTWRNITPQKWSDVDIVKNQCHLMLYVRKLLLMKLKNIANAQLSEEEGWLLYVLEQGILWDKKT
jgi:hypothetical protein